MNSRIAVTGRGILTANAASVPEFAEALRAGRSGIRPLTVIDPTPYYCGRAGEVAQLGDDGRKPRARVFQLLRAAVDQAVAEAGAAWLEQSAGRTGIVVGSTTGGTSDAETRLLESWRSGRSLDPQQEEEILDELSLDALSAPIARMYGLRGPMATISVSCASGGSAVGLALSLIASGDAEAMVVAGCEAISRTSFGGFAVLRAMAQESCRPFDRDRDGMMIGEGAAALVLERAEQAEARGARICAEIVGVGACNDAYHSVMPHPKGEGLAASVLQALTAAGIGPGEIDLVSAHATATPLNDAMERSAYRAVFGDRLSEIPIMAIKPLVGHTLGAAGTVELMAVICALEGGFVPPTVGHALPDEGCPLWVVKERAVERQMRYAVCCNAAFAGNNTAVVVARPRGADRRSQP